MRFPPSLPAAILALLLAGPAAAQGVLRKASEDGIAAECRAAGGAGTPRAGAIVETDINGDGKPDLVVDYQQAGCKRGDGRNPFCTVFGCTVRVMLSAGGNPSHKAFEGQVEAWRIRRGKHGAQFQTRRASAFCQGGDRKGCSEIFEAKGVSLARVSTGNETFARDVQRAPRLAHGGDGDEARPAARRRARTALPDRGRDSKPYEPPPGAETALTPTPAAPIPPSSQTPRERRRLLESAPYVP